MLHLKTKFDPLTKIKTFWDSLDVTITANKRELFLGLTTCVLSGLVVGMLISPKKNVTVGSHNGSNNSGNGCNNAGTLTSEEEEEA